MQPAVTDIRRSTTSRRLRRPTGVVCRRRCSGRSARRNRSWRGH